MSSSIKLKKEKRELQAKMLKREQYINYYQTKKREERKLKRLKGKHEKNY